MLLLVFLLLTNHIADAFTVQPNKHSFGISHGNARISQAASNFGDAGAKHSAFLEPSPLNLGAQTVPVSIISRARIYSALGSATSDSEADGDETPRGRMRRITGFSLTALRSTMRAATGFSLTALRTTVRAATGISITGTMRAILSVFPTWFRYFLQPFLIMYYVPLLLLRGLVGPTKTYKSEAKAAHEQLVANWSDAIKAAEAAQKGGYWPVHVDEDGSFRAAMPPDPDTVLDITDAVAESVEVASSLKSEDDGAA